MHGWDQACRRWARTDGTGPGIPRVYEYRPCIDRRRADRLKLLGIDRHGIRGTPIAAIGASAVEVSRSPMRWERRSAIAH
jgi:hypothetical protein